MSVVPVIRENDLSIFPELKVDKTGNVTWSLSIESYDWSRSVATTVEQLEEMLQFMRANS